MGMKILLQLHKREWKHLKPKVQATLMLLFFLYICSLIFPWWNILIIYYVLLTLQVVQDRVIAFWFPDKLEMVFGVIVCILRLGNVTNFLATTNMAELLGLQMAVWVG